MEQTAYEHNTGFSSFDNDPEASEHLLSNSSRKINSKLNNYLRPTILFCFICFALASISFISAHYANMGKVVNAQILNEGLMKYQAGHPGLLEIKAGCVNLYPLNPKTSPDTVGFVICDDKGPVDIPDVGFSANDFDKGISYLQTGPDCWINLYSNENFGGYRILIGPMQDLDLENTPKGNWNDRTRSLKTFRSKGDTAVLVKDSNTTVGDNCAILYGTDPNFSKHCVGVELCADFSTESMKNFTYEFIMEHKLDIKKMADGVSYIVTGKYVELLAFEGQNNDGQMITIPVNSEKSLKKVFNKNAAQDNNPTWNDIPMSFSLIDREVPGIDNPFAGIFSNPKSKKNKRTFLLSSI